MPLVAVALAVSTLWHDGSPALTSATSSLLPSPSMASVSPSSSSPSASVVFEPSGRNDPSAGPSVRWVAPHAETTFWSAAGTAADEVDVVHQWVPLQVVGLPQHGRLPVWDPSTRRRGWVEAMDVGPIDPLYVGTAYLPPIGRPAAWGGPARITMYSCIELGGCAPTASGIWPEPGIVAVDPAVIPLGSTIWVQGLGTLLAADTGRLVRGAHLDVFSLSYRDAIDWGVQERSVLVFPPR
jgi:3D (Asp-Asp-Asp) domain-containing protein